MKKRQRDIRFVLERERERERGWKASLARCPQRPTRDCSITTHKGSVCVCVCVSVCVCVCVWTSLLYTHTRLCFWGDYTPPDEPAASQWAESRFWKTLESRGSREVQTRQWTNVGDDSSEGRLAWVFLTIMIMSTIEATTAQLITVMIIIICFLISPAGSLSHPAPPSATWPVG